MTGEPRSLVLCHVTLATAAPAPTRTESRHARHIPRPRNHPSPHGPSAQRRRGLLLPASAAPAPRLARSNRRCRRTTGDVVDGVQPASPQLPAARGKAERGMPGNVVRRAARSSSGRGRGRGRAARRQRPARSAAPRGTPTPEQFTSRQLPLPLG